MEFVVEKFDSYLAHWNIRNAYILAIYIDQELSRSLCRWLWQRLQYQQYSSTLSFD